MKILHLTLEKKWFDMILSGEKKEEYREIKPYWAKRLVKNVMYEFESEFTTAHIGRTHNRVSCDSLNYDIVRFRNGYHKNSPTIDIQFWFVIICTGKPEWGAKPGQPYFVIKLGDILKTYNL